MASWPFTLGTNFGMACHSMVCIRDSSELGTQPTPAGSRPLDGGGVHSGDTEEMLAELNLVSYTPAPPSPAKCGKCGWKESGKHTKIHEVWLALWHSG